MTLECSCQRETDLKHTIFVRHALLYCLNKYLREIKCVQTSYLSVSLLGQRPPKYGGSTGTINSNIRI